MSSCHFLQYARGGEQDTEKRNNFKYPGVSPRAVVKVGMQTCIMGTCFGQES